MALVSAEMVGEVNADCTGRSAFDRAAVAGVAIAGEVARLLSELAGPTAVGVAFAAIPFEFPVEEVPVEAALDEVPPLVPELAGTYCWRRV